MPAANMEPTARFQPYPQYKDSGIEWSESCPASWDVLPLFSVMREREVKNSGLREMNVLSLSYGNIIRRDVENNMGLLPESFETYQIIEPGNIILRLTDLQNDKRSLRVGYVRERGIITSAYTCLQTKERLLPAYTSYLLLAYDLMKVFYGYGGGVRQTMKFEDLKWMPILLPPLPEQHSITAFLDRETGRIDELIRKKERQIELLQEKRQALISHAVTKGLDPNAKLKDSGIEWLGMVPEGWNVGRVKRLVSKIGSGITPRGGAETYKDSGVMLLRSQNIHFDGLRLDDVAFIDPEVDEEMRDSRVCTGDVLLNITGASLGRCAYFTSDRPAANVNQHVCILRPCKAKVTTNYLWAVISSRIVQSQIFGMENGSSREGLNYQQVGNLTVPIPSLAIQLAIEEFLTKETKRIDELSAKIRTSIDTLREYRTALISAAVTGKIDVQSYSAVEQPVKQVPLEFRRAVLAAEIVQQLHADSTFGHVKFQKILFLCENHLGLDIGGTYQRQAAGPYDNRMIRSIDSQLKKSLWFEACSDGKGTHYKPLAKVGGHKQYYERYWGSTRDQINHLLSLLRRFDSEHCEIVATLFAAWNDLLLTKSAISQDDIVREVRENWHESKARFEPDRLHRALDWMEQNGLTPSGHGKPTTRTK